MSSTATELGAGTTMQQGIGGCSASLRLMSTAPAGQDGDAQFTVQYPPNTPTEQQFLAPGLLTYLPINPKWTGRLSPGEILETGAHLGGGQPCAQLRLMSAPISGQGGFAQFMIEYPANTPESQQFLTPGEIVNLGINSNWGGTLTAGTILEIGAPGT